MDVWYVCSACERMTESGFEPDCSHCGTKMIPAKCTACGNPISSDDHGVSLHVKGENNLVCDKCYNTACFDWLIAQKDKS